ncbi:hypothetical protein DB30_04413 [Enhygromyxa salina]|uniref:Uncharacterized protein n=1 Tax=Enhygromyxa salina TaxID=215803 RepID=A0A0C2D474_9BACT|nr:hypothetical protein [Enhygromyxa salina]KIG16500.1 hypothetical protein DB30_04413 [Enhygromyxa salina]
MAAQTLRRGFHVAAAFNILGTLLFSRGLTNDLLGELDPGVFGIPGLLLICIWGLAYLALADSFEAAPRVALVFAIEKLFYVGNWICWLTIHGGELGEVWSRDPMTAVFYASYGLGDGAFALFFIYVWTRRPPAGDGRI